jgi:predicted patatin/cPLA2 family phospholipase
MIKVGLVLEGGGMRGIYTAGVLDYFLDRGIMFHNIIAVSAGACNAASYISKQRGRNFRINTSYTKDKRYISLGGLLTKGSIFGMDFIFNEIPNRLDPFDYKAYEASKSHLTVVTTDCDTGLASYHNGKEMDKVNQYLRASSSIPMFAPMVDIGGKKFLDGGSAESIPILRSIEEGNSKHIVVLTRNKGYIKKPDPFQSICKIKYRRYPQLLQTIESRHERYNKSIHLLEKLEQKGDVIIIRPSRKVEIERFEKNTHKLEDLYQNGYEDAKDLYPKIYHFCRESNSVEFF